MIVAANANRKEILKYFCSEMARSRHSSLIKCLLIRKLGIEPTESAIYKSIISSETAFSMRSGYQKSSPFVSTTSPCALAALSAIHTSSSLAKH
jgi:hypothetical protein